MLPIKDVMTKDVLTIKKDTPVKVISSDKRRIPVTNKGNLVGLASRSGIVKLIVTLRPDRTA